LNCSFWYWQSAHLKWNSYACSWSWILRTCYRFSIRENRQRIFVV